MEPWQKSHIDKNISQLVQETFCNVILVSYLLEHGIITTDDWETLQAIKDSKGRTDQSFRFYTIIKTRLRGYENLTNSLFRCNQTGALKVLLDGFSQNGVHRFLRACNIPINYKIILSSHVDLPLGKVSKVCDIFPGLTIKDIEDIFLSETFEKEYVDFFLLKLKNLEIVRDTIPKPLSIYIPRKVSNRVEVSSEIFKCECDDVFVLKGIDRHSVTKLAGENSSASSSDQLDGITARFIYLENDVDWEDICSISTSPAHLISVTNSTYFVEATTGKSQILYLFLIRQDKCLDFYIAEEDILQNMERLGDKNGMAFCDTAGMGKTSLLASLARKTILKFPNSIVAYVQLPHLVEGFSTVDLENPNCTFGVIFDILVPSALAKSILLKAMEKRCIQVSLFLDGLDEVPERYLEQTKRFLKSLTSTKASIRVYIASRPHLRNELEISLGVVSYDILPLTETQQLEYLISFWKHNSDGRSCEEARLNDFGAICLQQLKKFFSKEEHDLFGIPLHCFLLAQVNLSKALIYSNPRRQTLSTDSTLVLSVSMYDLLKEYVNLQFSNKNEKKRGCSASQFQKDKKFHVWAALKVIFPEVAEEYSIQEEIEAASTTKSYLGYGLLNVYDSNGINELVFTHRTFAEYLVMEFFADVITGSSYMDHESFASNIVNHAVNLLFSRRSRLQKYNQTQEFCCFQYYYEIPLEPSLDFCHLEIIYLLNSYLKSETNPTSKPRLSSFLKTCTPSTFFESIAICVFINFTCLLKLLSNMLDIMPLKILGRYKRYAVSQSVPINRGSLCLPLVLFYLAAASRDVTIVHVTCKMLQDNFNINRAELRKQNISFCPTPIYWAVKSARYEIVEFLIDKVDLEGQMLLYTCVKDSYGESCVRVKRRKDVLKLLLEQNRSLLYESGRNSNYRNLLTVPLALKLAPREFLTGPLVSHGVHLELIKYLITEGADINSTRGGHSVVMLCAKYMHSNDYHELIDFLVNQRMEFSLFLANASKSYYPVHYILFMARNQIKKETVDIILSVPGVHVNTKDEDGNTLLLSAADGNQSHEVLKKLVFHGADPHAINNSGKGILHFTAKSGNLESTKYFVSLGLSVNAKDVDGNTPLLSSYRSLDTFKYLVSQGANLNAMDNNNNTIVHLAAQIMSPTDFDELVSQIVNVYNAGHLFNVKEKRDGLITLAQRMESRLYEQTSTVDMICKVPNFNINETDKSGNSILMLAVQNRKGLDIIKCLISHGANDKHCNLQGNNVLHVAVEGENVDALKLFILRGVDIAHRNSQGHSPLDNAKFIKSGERQLLFFTNKGVLDEIILILTAAMQVD